jgi:small-conductance mechanosensitive channel
MAISPIASTPDGGARTRIFGGTRLVIFLALLMLLVLCLAFAWTTRGAMANLPFLTRQSGARRRVNVRKALVDISPWQTAQALAPLAVTAEEIGYAREAERLADHEVDQAFAAKLRMATLETQRRTLTGEALALSQKVTQFQQLVKEDQALVKSLTDKAGSSTGTTKDGAQPSVGGDDLDVAKAQLGLDSDQLSDAQMDLARVSGDQSAQIQQELAAHEASMRQYDSEVRSGGQVAVLSARRHGTLASRINSWFSQRSRNQLIQQALKQSLSDIDTLTAEHNVLEAKANADAAAAGRAEDLADIRNRRAMRQILGIYDDQIQTEKQLATVYGKWSTQVSLQHRIVFHLMLQSIALIVFILICMLVCDTLVQRLMAHPALDRRQTQTLRTILKLGIQVVGALLILLVIFGTPQQTPTILGLATAGITIVMQDFILAFFGWFVLMGKNGIRVGDWVEINGVGGEVTEVGVIRTTLLETGKLADKGHPTGRRITFINSFAIRGQYFNFSTAGQWMWDEISATMPPSNDIHAMVERIQKAVLEEMEGNARAAEQEWKREARGDGVSRFSAAPVVNLRPSASDIEIQVRYVTRASERFEVRNRLYQRVVDLLHEQNKPSPAEDNQVAGDA